MYPNKIVSSQTRESWTSRPPNKQQLSFKIAQKPYEKFVTKNNDEDIRPVIVEPPSPKKMLWGEPTWFLLHTLSHKIREDGFYLIRNDLLNLMYSICCNLPCSDCASHAKIYLDNINFNTIQTKQQLKLMFFNFHNTVNKRKSFPEFSLENLDEKYSKANLKHIINYFIKYYTNTRGSVKMIAEDFHRKKIVENLIQWINKHSNFFDLHN